MILSYLLIRKSMYILNYEDLKYITSEMTFELLLLSGLVIIFIVSFCGLLQKIKRTYEQERILAERVAEERAAATRTPNAYFNSMYTPEECPGVFPSSPPPYTEFSIDPPPSYEEVIKQPTIYHVPTQLSSNSSSDQLTHVITR